MLTTNEIVAEYLTRVKDGIIADAESKSQKIPVKSFRVESIQFEGRLYAADYFKYLVTGRGPGKRPPPDKMLKFVQDNPQILEEARKIFKNISEKSLAFLIGRKIGRQGTDIFTGKKQGIDLEGAINAPKEEFLQRLAYHEALNVAGKIKQAVAA